VRFTPRIGDTWEACKKGTKHCLAIDRGGKGGGEVRQGCSSWFVVFGKRTSSLSCATVSSVM